MLNNLTRPIRNLRRELLQACSRLEIRFDISLHRLLYQVLHVGVEKSQELIEFYRPVTCLKVDRLRCRCLIPRGDVVSNLVIVINFSLLTFLCYDITRSLIIVANYSCLHYLIFYLCGGFFHGTSTHICLV